MERYNVIGGMELGGNSCHVLGLTVSGLVAYIQVYTVADAM